MSRSTAFLLLCAVCVLAVVAFGIVAARRTKPGFGASVVSKSTVPEATKTVAATENAAPAPEERSSSPAPETEPKKPQQVSERKTMMYFRANALGDNYGKLSVAPVNALDQQRYAPDLACDRVHFAGDRGVCLASDRGVFTTYSAISFDDQMHRGRSIPLNGVPSRVRVSPSGRLAAITVFLSGHSYAALNFATQTTIVDSGSGEVLADLDKFSVLRDGKPFQEPDFNFWGVTFSQDENRFYATLWSKATTYLVECDLAKRTARVIHDGVECPSLSPDNSRIAFKKRVTARRISWRIHVLDLKTLTEIPLGETRSVDDQVEWLDNEQILYALSEGEQDSSPSTDIWVLPARPGAVPRLMLKGAFSPAVVPQKN